MLSRTKAAPPYQLPQPLGRGWQHQAKRLQPNSDKEIIILALAQWRIRLKPKEEA